VPLENFILW